MNNEPTDTYNNEIMNEMGKINILNNEKINHIEINMDRLTNNVNNI